MSQQNGDFIRGLYTAFAEGDVAAVLAGMDPQIEWNEAENFPYADGNPYVGPAAVVEGVFKRLGEEWEYWNLSVEDILDAGDKVVALGRYDAVHKVNSTKIDAQFAHVWELRNGKIIKFQQYADTAQVSRAVQGK